MGMIETPRLVKKPGGLYKRVENQDELDAALAEGWFVRLPAPTGIMLTDAPEPRVVDHDDPGPEHTHPLTPLGDGWEEPSENAPPAAQDDPGEAPDADERDEADGEDTAADEPAEGADEADNKPRRGRPRKAR